jgi:hypothetical protein
MHYRVLRRAPLNTIAGNAVQEAITEQYDEGYDEQGHYGLDQAQAIPQLFHVVASHVPPSSTYRLKNSNRCWDDSYALSKNKKRIRPKVPQRDPGQCT